MSECNDHERTIDDVQRRGLTITASLATNSSVDGIEMIVSVILNETHRVDRHQLEDYITVY